MRSRILRASRDFTFSHSQGHSRRGRAASLEIKPVAHGFNSRFGARFVRIAAGRTRHADGAEQRSPGLDGQTAADDDGTGKAATISACIIPGWLIEFSSLVLVRKEAAVHAFPCAVDTV